MVENICRLFEAAKQRGIAVAVSPHFYYPHDHQWTFGGPLEKMMHGIGMSANLCVESHLRELLEQGFEVVVVRDATAAAKLPEGDGYLADLTNFRFIANTL
ncbi:isochorismatase family protein [Halomonas llamarensis]|uniref:Isochorismatase family protein n=1 Tax=Halomonas llamarensis TaxID=2945104 RepID=A0ABT0SS44_9GAMM|nr:isochorismatase family protein [Halomonas llamarensis]MCL7930645.1 isochorismatase family protein [Halomonas llamarensis]